MARDLDVGFTVFANTEPAVRPLVRFQREAAKSDKRLQEFNKTLNVVAQQRQRAFGAAVRGSAIALAGLGVGLLKTAKVAGDYDRQIRLAALLTKNTGEEFGEFDAGVKQISSDLAILPSQVAKAGQAVGKLGFEGADAMNVLRDGVTLARASIGELTSAQAVGATATFLRAFGEDASQSGRAIDILTTGVTSTALSFDKLPTALSTASGFAASFGATMEETIAILGATNDIITKTERASTGVRNIFRDLSQVTTQQKLASAGLTLEVKQANGEFRGILPILTDLFSQTEKMTEAQRLQTLQQAFTVEAAGALFAISQRLTTGFRDQNGEIIKGVEGLKVLVDRMGTTGTASALAEEQLKGFAGSMEKFKTEGTLLSVEVGAALSTVLGPALDFITGLITDLKEAFQGASPSTKFIIGLLGTAAIVLGIVAGVIIAASLAMGGWTFATGLATSANLAFIASLGPIALVLGGIVALVLIFSKQIKKAFALALRARAAVNQFFGLRGELSAEEQEEIDRLEGKPVLSEEGEAALSASAKAVGSGVLSPEAIASALPSGGRRERAAVEAGGTREEIGERIRGATGARPERAAAAGEKDINVTLEMDSKKVGEAIITRQERENRRTFRRVQNVIAG